MEYHSDRFLDHSLLILEEKKLIAVFPANIKGEIIISHEGLTYGGLIYGTAIDSITTINIFSNIKEYFKEVGIKKIIYKLVPYIYHKYPSNEDLYALFLNEARLFRRDLSSTIYLQNPIAYSKKRRGAITKGKKNSLEIRKSTDIDTFMNIETELLDKKYHTIPTHTAQELKMLMSLFPNNIDFYAAFSDNEMVAGVVIYITENVAHLQYIAANDKGKKLYAADLIIDYLISSVFHKKIYFDFGISTEKDGKVLNKGLLKYKEAFGARAVVYDFFELLL
jgi:hypothetical protein